MKKLDDDDERKTRSQLALTVLWFLGILAAGAFVLLAFGRRLALSPDVVTMIGATVGGVCALNGMTFRFYFRRK